MAVEPEKLEGWAKLGTKFGDGVLISNDSTVADLIDASTDVVLAKDAVCRRRGIGRENS